MGLSRTRLWWILVGAHQGVSPGPTFGNTHPRQDAIPARDHPGPCASQCSDGHCDCRFVWRRVCVAGGLGYPAFYAERRVIPVAQVECTLEERASEASEKRPPRLDRGSSLRRCFLDSRFTGVSRFARLAGMTALLCTAVLRIWHY